MWPEQCWDSSLEGERQVLSQAVVSSSSARPSLELGLLCLLNIYRSFPWVSNYFISKKLTFSPTDLFCVFLIILIRSGARPQTPAPPGALRPLGVQPHPPILTAEASPASSHIIIIITVIMILTSFMVSSAQNLNGTLVPTTSFAFAWGMPGLRMVQLSSGLPPAGFLQHNRGPSPVSEHVFPQALTTVAA